MLHETGPSAFVGTTGSSVNLDNNNISTNGTSVNGGEQKYKYAQRFLGQGRPLRIVMVGAGVTGIAAVKLYKDMFPERDVEFVIYEKNHDITGTWLENRYPG